MAVNLCGCWSSVPGRLQCKSNRRVQATPVAKDTPEGSGPELATVTGALRNGMSFYESLQVSLAAFSQGVWQICDLGVRKVSQLQGSF